MLNSSLLESDILLELEKVTMNQTISSSNKVVINPFSPEKLSQVDQLSLNVDDSRIMTYEKTKVTGLEAIVKSFSKEIINHLNDNLSLNDLTDVEIENPTNGQALVYINGSWVNQNISSTTYGGTETSATPITAVDVVDHNHGLGLNDYIVKFTNGLEGKLGNSSIRETLSTVITSKGLQIAGGLRIDGLSHLTSNPTRVLVQEDSGIVNYRNLDEIITGVSTVPHELVSSYHTVSDLTTGHFLKALSATTFGFAAHGLSYSDVGAQQYNSILNSLSSLSTSISGFVKLTTGSASIDTNIYATHTDLSTGINVITFPTITDNGDGSFTVASTTCNLRDNANWENEISSFSVAEATITPSDWTQQYLTIQYSLGIASYVLISDKSLINHSNIVGIAAIWRLGNIIRYTPFGSNGISLSNKIDASILQTTPYRLSIDGGLAIGESATRYVTLTSGIVYVGTTANSLPSFNSLTDSMFLFYHSSGTWTYTQNTQYNNTQYDDGTDLVTSTNNKYLVRFMYRTVGAVKRIYYVLSTSDYNQYSDALNASIPSNLPVVITGHCILVGRIIVQYNATTATKIDSAFTTQFNSSGISDHSLLSNLYGVSPYYHLGETAYNYVKDIAGSAIGGSGTTNYSARFTNTTLIGSGSIYDNGSGNVSVGKSSVEAWSSSFRALQVGGNTALMGFSTEISGQGSYVLNNCYYDGSFKATTSGAASMLYQSSNAFFWRINDNLTANVAFSATVVMSLSSAGLLTVASTTVHSGQTASTVPYFNASKYLVSSTVTPTELGYLSGVTSAIQTQLGNKQALNSILTSISGLSTSSTGLVKLTNGTASLDASTYLTANQTITLSGDVTGSGTTAITTALSTTGVTAGTYGSAIGIPSIAIDSKGRITSASNIGISATSPIALNLGVFSHANSGVTAGSYTYITVNSTGHITSGSTTISAGIWNGSTIGVAYGGTGNTSWTQYGLVYAPTSSTLSSLSTGTSGYALLSGGSGAAPSWGAVVTSLSATSPIVASASTGAVTLTHATSGVTAGTYKSVTVNAYGHITGGTNPTTLSGYGITDAIDGSGVANYVAYFTDANTIASCPISTDGTNISMGMFITGATATPFYLNTGLSYSNGYTKDKCKIYLYNTGTEQYGFAVGSASDIQYHSNVTHDFYINNVKVFTVNSTGFNVSGVGVFNALGSSEGGEINLAKATSYTYAAILDNYQDYFRIHNGTTTLFQVNLGSGVGYLNGYNIWTAGNLTNNLTTNYVPYWNGSTLANSPIYTNGTNVSVGKSSVEAWQSSYKALQIGGNSAIIGYASESGSAFGCILYTNQYYDGSEKAMVDGAATSFYQANGGFYWRSNTGLTADVAFTPTTVMSLSSAGDLTVAGYVYSSYIYTASSYLHLGSVSSSGLVIIDNAGLFVGTGLQTWFYSDGSSNQIYGPLSVTERMTSKVLCTGLNYTITNTSVITTVTVGDENANYLVSPDVTNYYYKFDGASEGDIIFIHNVSGTYPAEIFYHSQSCARHFTVGPGFGVIMTCWALDGSGYPMWDLFYSASSY